MADIFLSYSEDDRPAAARLAGALQAVGWSVWWDRRIPAGKTWRSVLEGELQRMRCMLVCWSARSVQSEWVCEEAAEGRQRHRLLPVLLERTRPPAGFREVQAADLIDWDGSPGAFGFLRLVEDIEAMIGKPDRPALAPALAPVSASVSAPVSTLPDPGAAARPLPPPSAVPRAGRRRWLGLGAASGAIGLAAVAIVIGRDHPPAPAVSTTEVVTEATRAVAADGRAGASVQAAVVPAAGAAEDSSSPQPQPARRDPPLTGSAALPTPSAAHQPADPRCPRLRDRVSMGETLAAESAALLQRCNHDTSTR